MVMSFWLTFFGPPCILFTRAAVVWAGGFSTFPDRNFRRRQLFLKDGAEPLPLFVWGDRYCTLSRFVTGAPESPELGQISTYFKSPCKNQGRSERIGRTTNSRLKIREKWAKCLLGRTKLPATREACDRFLRFRTTVCQKVTGVDK